MRQLFTQFFIFLCFLGSSCKNDEDKTKVDGGKVDLHQSVHDTYHNNIIIAPDLSNRNNGKLYPKPLKDQQIVDVVLSNIDSKIIKTTNRQTDQLDKFSVAFINKNLIEKYGVDKKVLNIDFASFNNQRERIEYIKANSGKSLKKDRVDFLQEYSSMIEKSSEDIYGSDIWSFLNNGVDNTIVRNDSKTTTYKDKNYRNIYRNVMILITDGYIEAGLYKKEGCLKDNQCYYLSKNRIDDFRRDFINSGKGDLKEFFHEKKYSIVPCNNPNLKNLEILVLELYDRSLSKGGNATVHPTDMDIMQLFWTDWLSKSKVKRFELRPVLASKNDAEKVILEFLNIK